MSTITITMNTNMTKRERQVIGNPISHAIFSYIIVSSAKSTKEFIINKLLALKAQNAIKSRICSN
jgi:hypothetical protein